MSRAIYVDPFAIAFDETEPSIPEVSMPDDERRPRARYYTMAEAAAYCRQSIRTLHRAIKAGELKSSLVRHRRRFLKTDLDAYLDGIVIPSPANHP